VLGKLISGFGVVIALLLLVAGAGLYSLRHLGNSVDALTDVEMPGVIAVVDAQTAAMRMQRDLRQAMVVTGAQKNEQARQSYEAADKEYNQRIETLGTLLQTAEAKARLDDLKKASTALAAVRAKIMAAAIADDNATADALLASDENAKNAATVNEILEYLVQNKTGRAEAIGHDAGVMERSASTLMVVVTLVAVAAALGVAFGLALPIRNGVRSIQAVLTSITNNCATSLERGLGAMADGDLTVEVRPATKPIEKIGTDEIGQTARITNLMLGKLQTTIEGYERARLGLADVVSQIQEVAEGVAESSGHLGSVADQSSHAVTQVTIAMQHIASGSQDAAGAAQESTEAVSQLSDAIDSIARGAGDQAHQVQAAAATAEQMSAQVEQVATDARDVARAGEATRDSAAEGAEAVRETVAGMAEIRTVIADAAGTVEDLGRLGDKIGNVVETFDDIAAQTNLLALNAAIEAARAGEHGKGFAVVADEVRKLAERSQRETKAISELIRDVQSRTRDAVSAMKIGSERVEHGSVRADRAGTALTDIVSAVEQMVDRVKGIAGAASEMANGARGVVASMQSISAVVEENSASTEEMAAQATQVSQGIESIASASEQSSASIQEVSASAEEMSAQIDVVSAQAGGLATSAAELRGLIQKFHIDHAPAAPAQPARGTRRAA
jgi:methyl-accepting chemotaxis protein